MKKKILAALLILCMVISLVPMSVFAVFSNYEGFLLTGSYSNGDGYTPYNLAMRFIDGKPVYSFDGQFEASNSGNRYEITTWDLRDLSAGTKMNTIVEPEAGTLNYRINSEDYGLSQTDIGAENYGLYFFTVQAFDANGNALSELISSDYAYYFDMSQASIDTSAFYKISNMELKISEADWYGQGKGRLVVKFNHNAPIDELSNLSYEIYTSNPAITYTRNAIIENNYSHSESAGTYEIDINLTDFYDALPDGTTLTGIKVIAGSYHNNDVSSRLISTIPDEYFVEGENMLTFNVTASQEVSPDTKTLEKISETYLDPFSNVINVNFKIEGLPANALYNIAHKTSRSRSLSLDITSDTGMIFAADSKGVSDWFYGFGDVPVGGQPNLSEHEYNLYTSTYSPVTLIEGVPNATITNIRHPLDFDFSYADPNKQELVWGDGTANEGVKTLAFNGSETYVSPTVTNNTENGGAVTYYMWGNNGIANINETTGEVEVIGVGEVLIIAVATAANGHSETVISYTLQVTGNAPSVNPPIEDKIPDNEASEDPIISIPAGTTFTDTGGNAITPKLTDMEVVVTPNVLEAEKTAMNANINNPNAGTTKLYLDISLTSGGLEVLPNGAVEIFVPYSEISPITKDSVIEILHMKSDGTYETITPTMLDSGIRFVANGLSPFTIYNVVASTTTPTTPTTPETDVPRTGDNSNPALMVALMGMSIIGLGTVYVNKKKSKANK